jgi:hypothetical protein
MIRDRALRSLLVVGLVLLDAILAIGLIGWLVMGVGMSGGMMGRPGLPTGLMFGAGALGLLILAGVIAAMIWALRSPFGDEASSGPGQGGGDRPEEHPLIHS